MTNSKTRWLSIAALVTANIVVLLFAITSIYGNRQHHVEDAKDLTRNVASALELNVAREVEKIDLALGSVVDELELQLQLSERGIDEEANNALLARLEQRLPEVEAIRVARADGLVILGKGLNKENRPSWSDSDSFRYLRDHAGADLHVSEPLMGRVSMKYVIGFSKRYNNPDGSFAGVVAAPILIEHFTSLMAQFNVGPNGTLILRDAQLRLISRMPALPNNPAGQVGNQVVSQDFRQIFDSGLRSATNLTSASPDGFERMFTFRRLTKAPMIAIVAVASQDYLATWKEETYVTSALAAGFLVLAILLGRKLLGLVRSVENHLQQIEEERTFAASILDSLTAHIAVIDVRGVIVAVNASWRRFARDNGAYDNPKVSVGANYFDVCASMAESPISEGEVNVLAGIRSVLDGKQQQYVAEYACHSPVELRWFVLRVVPLLGVQRGAVIFHQDVTARYLAQAELKASEDKFRLIAENTSDGVIIFDANQHVQYVSPAYVAQLGCTEADELGRTPESIHELIHPEDRDRVFSSIYAAVESKTIDLLYTYRARHKAGHYIWREDHARFNYDDFGAMSKTYVICRDVGQRKAEEERQRHLSARLLELSQRLIQAQEQARHHLALELHELTSPNLAALRINLAMLAKATPAERAHQDFSDRVADTRALIDDTTSSIRDICAELHSTVLEGGGMLGVVQNYAQQFAKRTGLKVTVHCDHEETHLARALALPLFRIVQEAMTNCAKHANASSLEISLKLASFPMRLSITDDGVGFDLSQVSEISNQHGLGLLSMRETAEFVGGNLTVCSRPGGGTSVCVDIALPPKEASV